MPSSSSSAWTNWAGGVSFEPGPGGVREPRTEGEIADAVREARQRRVPCRVVGHGHSFNRSMCADGGVALSLRKYRRVLAVDAAARTVTCEAGITLVQLLEHLQDHEPPLTLENVPVVIAVTVGGALCSAAHGSGRNSPSLSAQMLGCTLVDGRGEVVSIDRSTNAHLLPAARASLGVLGVLSTVTLSLVPAHTLHIAEGPLPLHECLERMDELAGRFEYFKAWWVPHTGYVHAFCIDRRPVPPVEQLARSAPPPGETEAEATAAAGARGALRADDVGTPAVAAFLNSRAGGAAHEGLYALATATPAATPLVNRTLRPLLFPPLRAADASYVVQCNEHRAASESAGVRFDVSEFALPAEALRQAMAELAALVSSAGGGHYLSFPVDLRFSAADDIWLSPAYGRASAWVGIPAKRPFGRETEHGALFAAFESLMLRHGGRPHWAKEHSLRAPQLRPLYARWEDFMRVRQALDPDGVFLNDYLRELLGVPPADQAGGGPHARL